MGIFARIAKQGRRQKAEICLKTLRIKKKDEGYGDFSLIGLARTFSRYRVWFTDLISPEHHFFLNS